MVQQAEVNRICWQCRRGLLELDLLLGPFATREYAALSDAERQCFQELLECADGDLLAWFHAQAEPPVRFRTLIERITAFSLAC